MKKLRIITHITFVFIFTIMLSCQVDKNTDFKNYIQKIDNIPVSKSLYVFKVDSNENIIDTLGMRILKYDINKNLVFESNLQLKSDLITINYYDTLNGVIYSEVKSSNEMFSNFTTTIENGLIISANYNIYDGTKKVDSVVMSYNYTFNKGKKAKLVIDSGDSFYTIEHYNFSEKPTLNFSLSHNDTVEMTKFIYDKNNILREKIFKHFSKDEEIIYKYNESNDLIEELYFKNKKLEASIYYNKDEEGNYLSFTKYNK